MRNLKKILALVLSLMMVLSVMVTASAADYSDADDIQYAEAVEVMSALGILSGADGKFDPQGTLTRSQAAKIITYVALGADAANLVKGTGSDLFTDVTGGWAYDYISYCANEGIINGAGDGKFYPNAEVTGYQFGKMLLNVLGIEGTYTGSGWTLNVSKALKANGLTSNMAKNFSLNNNITREEAAQLAFNALYFGDTVEKTVTKYVVLPISGTFATNGTAVMALEYDDFSSALADALSVSGTPVYMTDFIINSVSKTVDVPVNTLAQTAYGMENEVVITAVDDIQPDTDPNSKTYGKLIATDSTATYAWVVDNYDSLGTVVGIYATTRGVVKAVVEYSFTVDVYGMTAAEWKATFGNGYYAVDGDYNFGAIADRYENGDWDGSSMDVSAPTGTDTYNEATKLVFWVNYSGKYYPMSAIVNEYDINKVNVSKNADGTIVAQIEGGEVVYNGKIDTATGKVTKDVDYSDIDWASYYNVDATKSFGYFTIQEIDNRYYFKPVETVTGTITAIGVGDSYVVMNGKTYAASTDPNTTDNTSLTGTPAFGTTYTLYLDSYGDFFAAVPATAASVASDVYYVVATYPVTEYDAYGASTTKTYAQVVGMNGEASTILVGVNATNNTYKNGEGVNNITAGLYTFANNTTDAAGVKLGIKEATSFTNAIETSSDIDLLVSTGKITVGSDDIRLNAATKYLFIDGEKATLKTEVVTGGVNCTVDSGSYIIATVDSDGNKIASTVVISGTYNNAGAVEANKLIYVADGTDYTSTVAYTKADGTIDAGYVYVVYDAATGEKVTITATNTTLNAGFHTYKLNNGIYDVTVAAESTGVADGVTYEGKYGTLVTAGSLEDAETKDAVIVDLRSAADKASSGVSTITSVADMAYWTVLGSDITFTALYKTVDGAQVVSIIFVTDATNI